MKPKASKKPAVSLANSEAQNALAALERAANNGDKAARARLAKAYKLLNVGKPKRGRPVGAKSKFTDERFSREENGLRAYWGDLAKSPGGMWANMILSRRDPEKILLDEEAKKRGMTPAEVLAEKKSEPLDPLFVPFLTDAIDRRDATFFADFAAALTRFKNADEIDYAEPREVAFYIYVGALLWGNPGYKFTKSELWEIQWGKDENGQSYAPSDRELDRLIQKFSAPMLQGRPRKK